MKALQSQHAGKLHLLKHRCQFERFLPQTTAQTEQRHRQLLCTGIGWICMCHMFVSPFCSLVCAVMWIADPGNQRYLIGTLHVLVVVVVVVVFSFFFCSCFLLRRRSSAILGFHRSGMPTLLSTNLNAHTYDANAPHRPANCADLNLAMARSRLENTCCEAHRAHSLGGQMVMQ